MTLVYAELYNSFMFEYFKLILPDVKYFVTIKDQFG